jgi:hypothetical protein
MYGMKTSMVNIWFVGGRVFGCGFRNHYRMQKNPSFSCIAFKPHDVKILMKSSALPSVWICFFFFFSFSGVSQMLQNLTLEASRLFHIVPDIFDMLSV